MEFFYSLGAEVLFKDIDFTVDYNNPEFANPNTMEQ